MAGRRRRGERRVGADFTDRGQGPPGRGWDGLWWRFDRYEWATGNWDGTGARASEEQVERMLQEYDEWWVKKWGQESLNKWLADTQAAFDQAKREGKTLASLRAEWENS